MIKMSLTQLPLELDPIKLRMMEHFLLLQLFSQTLVRVNEKGKLVSYLAKRWEFDHDTNEYVFTLHNNIKFSDGTPVLAEDVAWSLSRHFWDGSTSVVANYLKVVLKDANSIPQNTIHPNFTVKNEHTISIKLKSFYSPFLQVLSMPGFSITKFDKDGFNNIGSGPLKIASANSSKSINFVKNNYFADAIELNEVCVIELSDTKNIANLMKDGEIDLSIGFNFEDIIKLANTGVDFVVTPSESLATIHAYFNTNGILKSDEYRRSVFSLFSRVADEYAKNNTLIERQKEYFPAGIMSQAYYNAPLEEVQISEIKSPIKVVLNENVFPQNFVDLLKSMATSENINLDIKVYSSIDLINSLVNKSYDVVATRYVGNFSDPDAFLDSINSESPIHLGEFKTKKLFSELEKFRYEPEREKRLLGYANSFQEFEKNKFIAPLFRLRVPIIHRKELALPNTNFKYEGELWRIFWKN